MLKVVSILLFAYSAFATYMYYKLNNDSKSLFDIEDKYEQVRQELGFYKYAIEEKQLEYDKMEDTASKMKQENQKLNEQLQALNKSLLDLPKLLGKTLGK